MINNYLLKISHAICAIKILRLQSYFICYNKYRLYAFIFFITVVNLIDIYKNLAVQNKYISDLLSANS